MQDVPPSIDVPRRVLLPMSAREGRRASLRAATERARAAAERAHAAAERASGTMRAATPVSGTSASAPSQEPAPRLPGLSPSW
jgi:hypothetical protein